MFTKKISFGLIIWAIPYLTAIPLLPLRQIDPAFFKTIMIVEGLFVGAIMTVLYFIPVKKDFLREGVILGVVWILVNWIMDYFALLPFTHSGCSQIFYRNWFGIYRDVCNDYFYRVYSVKKNQKLVYLI